MSVFADKCHHIIFEVVDVNKDRIDSWNSDDLSKLPIFEPELDKVIRRRRGKNLFFSYKVYEAIASADMIFISVNTPTKTRGIGAGKASDLRWVESCARDIAKFAQGYTIVVEKSTLPVRTGELIKSILSSNKNSSLNKNPQTFDVLSNPEFLSEGTAIKDLEFPDRILIGGENEEASKLLGKMYENWVPTEKIIYTNLWSSELAKLTANAFLAQRISSINSIGALCEVTGADIREVSRAIGRDSRIGAKFLNSGPGFGGSCFKKDILNLVYLANYFGLPEVGNFWEEVVTYNNWNQNRLTKIILDSLFGTLKGKNIGILGFAFKANTNDTRESPAIQICKNLLEEGVSLRIHDPKVDEKQIAIDLECPSKITFLNNTGLKETYKDKQWNKAMLDDDFFLDLDAVVILTEWDMYSKIDWLKASKKMRTPGWIFDSRLIVDLEKVIDAGLNVWRVGDGTISRK
jgi:UDPglucose 6-dehydrogenase